MAIPFWELSRLSPSPTWRLSVNVDCRNTPAAVNGVSQDLSECWTQELLAQVISGVVWIVAM
jgi:hypothetical protein